MSCTYAATFYLRRTKEIRRRMTYPRQILTSKFKFQNLNFKTYFGININYIKNIQHKFPLAFCFHGTNVWMLRTNTKKKSSFIQAEFHTWFENNNL
jgi:hypothetical protein